MEFRIEKIEPNDINRYNFMLDYPHFLPGGCYQYNSFCCRGFFRGIIIKERMPTRFFQLLVLQLYF